jgi:ribonuclease J
MNNERPSSPHRQFRPHRGRFSRTAAPRGGSHGAAEENAARRPPQPRRVHPQRRRTTAPALTHRLSVSDDRSPVIPAILDEDTVRIITVAGVEEIGRNMNIVETKDDIVIIDAGFQFVSEETNTPGVNYILPNTQYLEERQSKIRGLIITHGHLDHIGGIPFIMERIGNPPIYTQYLTSLMILKRQAEFPHMNPLEVKIVNNGEHFMLGNLKVKCFSVTHSIPNAMGVSIETKHGDVVITGDVKLTHEDGQVAAEERALWEKVGQNNNIALLCDSTNADREGFSVPEAKVFETLENIIGAARGRLIIGTFASQFDRLVSIIKACEDMGKKVVVEGRSIKTNVDIALQAKLISVKPQTFIGADEINNFPADRIVILSTGAQGEEFAALMRMATDKHKFITLNERDAVVLSSSVIPGNELAVQRLKDNIYRKNVRVISYRGSHVHSSGHGNAGELVWIHQTVKPKFLVPIHGHHFHLKSHMYAAIENGFPRERIIVPDNGTIIDIKNGAELHIPPVKIPNELVLVEGFTVGTKQEVVLKDRQTLAQDGMFVIIATVNARTGKLRKSPDIISRGFVYLRENQPLLSEARVLIKRTVEQSTERMQPIDLEVVKDELTNAVSSFLLQKTQKNPMVIPVLIGI